MTETLGFSRVFGGEPGTSRTTWAVLAALLGHGILMGIAMQQEPSFTPRVAVTEVELLKPRQVVPVVPPPVAPDPARAPEPATQPRAPRRAAPSKAPAPQPAMAAPLRTVAEQAPSSDEPVRFVTDPNGSAFGYGTVARGGTALAGARAAALPGADTSNAKETGQPLLSRPPMLGEADPCRGFFPVRAQVDRGEVALKVKVEADGRVRTVSVARETPLGHGFGFAARDCLLSKRFSPALDVAGREVSVVSPVTVRFSR